VSQALATELSVSGTPEGDWLVVCRYDDLIPERAVCAIVAGRQVAIVRMSDGALYGVTQRDPFSGSYVLSRGIAGTRRHDGVDVPVLQSPLFKQAFDLRTGRCIEDPGVQIVTYAVRERRGLVEVRAQPIVLPDGPQVGGA
jgi:nitrite reductase (NADH) small subunit